MSDDIPTPAKGVYIFFDYIALGFVLVAVEELVRGSSWKVWSGCLGLGAAFLFVGVMGPRVKAKGASLVMRFRRSTALATENANLKAKIVDLRRRLEVQPAIAADIPRTRNSGEMPGFNLKDRVIVDASPDELLKFFKDHVSVQAHKLLEAYIGQWMVIRDAEVRNIIDLVSGQVFITLNIDVGLTFDADWKQKVSVLKKGSRITAVGQIKGVILSGTSIDLEKCELLGS